MMGKNKVVTENSLSLALRDLYLGLIKSDKDIGISKRKLELTKNKYGISQLKFVRGLITKQDLDESEYELLKAEKSFDEVERNKDNMVRSLNALLGVEIDTAYETVTYDEFTRNINFKPLEYYIEKALNERLEIKNIEEEIRLKELKQAILTKSKLYGKSYDVNDQYDDVALEIESLKAKLEKTRFDMENEIKTAYIEIKNDINDIESTTETLNMQKRSLEKLKNQYDRGFIAKIVLDELEIGISEFEIDKELVIYNYNTKIMKLEEAAGLGPAY
jgi:outer membrane protein TolC